MKEIKKRIIGIESCIKADRATLEEIARKSHELQARYNQTSQHIISLKGGLTELKKLVEDKKN